MILQLYLDRMSVHMLTSPIWLQMQGANFDCMPTLVFGGFKPWLGNFGFSHASEFSMSDTSGYKWSSTTREEGYEDCRYIWDHLAILYQKCGFDLAKIF